MRPSTLKKKLEAAIIRVGKERDKLRDIESEAQDMAESCDQAIESLEYAVQSLSELA